MPNITTYKQTEGYVKSDDIQGMLDARLCTSVYENEQWNTVISAVF